ncbi:DUF4180 domain-containing protein [Aeromicrobium wangtongii]|uniref:DUF4180 domain-containing protein n=1 Tax=Aeromicrobium wangtongii TaxID=2969247 RepID=A0ABY5MB30_9ACTN|nr:DUF4180 domain-containing protein [Aeromicrobium wangtongii]MCD9199535.1 DUF4180 domain-containing protein [Aeromicrobium wangtongii]MCL3817286.1 DUF4180 domain-containing protein [Aeromicrobium wangtongii]UUP13888.1 DUF4180 domain-containing protein [Aeromicrobium wangtongii]
MTAEHLATVHGTAVMVCAPDGIPVDTEGAVVELLGEAIGLRARTVVVPAERLTDDFFQLSTGIAHHIAQRFATYRVRLAVVGDISRQVASSSPLRAWVDDANRGQGMWFCGTFHEFQNRLRAQ